MRKACPRVALSQPLEKWPCKRSNQLAAHRHQQLERLHAYAEAGEFPLNRTPQATLHMFKDPYGHLCAVANLVHQDGLDGVVNETVRTHNDVVLADVTEGPLHDWALSSGLTLEEIARIQAPARRLDYDQVAERRQAEARMFATLRAHFREVEAELRRDETASLDLAVRRLEQSRASSPQL